MEAVKIESVSVVFGNFLALENVSISVGSGTLLAIVGPNGAGKSTLLKVMSGIIKPAAGKVFLFGDSPELYRKKNPIGYLPQQQNLNMDLPLIVSDVVYMNLAVRKDISKKEKRLMVAEALNNVGMFDLRNRIFSYLSGGERQRVMVASAMVNMPKILFLDEPNTGVDIVNQDDFYDFISHLAGKHGITIIMVTHDVGVVSSYVDEIACINKKLYMHDKVGNVDINEAMNTVYGKTDRIVTHLPNNKSCFSCPFKDFGARTSDDIKS